jgi:glycosyltransferase involved in cell wall biosynthesis
VRRAPMAWLVIVGEGSEESALRAQAAALPAPACDRIVFTGRREDIASVTADLDVAALPSLREAQGISILEAMARVKPVVASAVGGVPEVLTDGVDGLLVPPESPSALADAIVRLAADPDLRERIGEAGWETVRHRFSIDAQVKRIEAVYDAELVRSGALAPLGSAQRRSGELASPARQPASAGSGSERSAAGRAPSDRATLEIPPV